ncbi:MAG: hypothetical protein O2816_17620 [Planctomycetota bacterium]|nr:hypothetical protein [Planctomycetota bacterium]
MRTKTLLTGLLAATLLVSTTSFSFLGSQDDEPTPLQQAMVKMQGSQKAMRQLIADPATNKAALLRACAMIQEGAHAGFSLAPKAPADADENQWRIGYQRTMLAVLDAALECELAVHAGDAEGVAAAYKKMGEHKKAGHDTYQK